MMPRGITRHTTHLAAQEALHILASIAIVPRETIHVLLGDFLTNIDDVG